MVSCLWWFCSISALLCSIILYFCPHNLAAVPVSSTPVQQIQWEHNNYEVYQLLYWSWNVESYYYCTCVHKLGMITIIMQFPPCVVCILMYVAHNGSRIIRVTYIILHHTQLQLLPLHFKLFVKMVALHPFASQEELQMKLWQSRQRTVQVQTVSTDSIIYYRMSSGGIGRTAMIIRSLLLYQCVRMRNWLSRI